MDVYHLYSLKSDEISIKKIKGGKQMNKNNFNNSIETVYITVANARTIAQLSRNTVMKIAENAEAIIRIGRSVRIDREKFLNALKNG